MPYRPSRGQPAMGGRAAVQPASRSTARAAGGRATRSRRPRGAQTSRSPTAAPGGRIWRSRLALYDLSRRRSVHERWREVMCCGESECSGERDLVSLPGPSVFRV